MGEEIYYVRVATAHGAHACVGLPMQIPPGQTHGERHPSIPPGRSRLRSTTENDGKWHEAEWCEGDGDQLTHTPVGSHPTALGSSLVCQK